MTTPASIAITHATSLPTIAALLLLACSATNGDDPDPLASGSGTWTSLPMLDPACIAKTPVAVDRKDRPVVACQTKGPVTTTRGSLYRWDGTAFGSSLVKTMEDTHTSHCGHPFLRADGTLAVICSTGPQMPTAVLVEDARPDTWGSSLHPTTETATAVAMTSRLGDLGFLLLVTDAKGRATPFYYGAEDIGTFWKWEAAPAPIAGGRPVAQGQITGLLHGWMAAYTDPQDGDKLHLQKKDTAGEADLGAASAGKASLVRLQSADQAGSSVTVAYRDDADGGKLHLASANPVTKSTKPWGALSAGAVSDLALHYYKNHGSLAFVDTAGGLVRVVKLGTTVASSEILPQTIPGPASLLSLASTEQINPILIYRDDSDSKQRARVMRWSAGDSKWEDLGYPFDGAAVATAIIWDSENETPWVSAITQTGAETRIQVARWQNSAWQATEALQDGTSGSGLSMGYLAPNLVVVGFNGKTGPTLARLGTGRWMMTHEVGTPFQRVVSPKGRIFALKDTKGAAPFAGTLWVARMEDDGTFTELGAATTRAGMKRGFLAVGPAEAPVLAYQDGDSAGSSTRVVRWQGGTGDQSRWSEIGSFAGMEVAGVAITGEEKAVVALVEPKTRIEVVGFTKSEVGYQDLRLHQQGSPDWVDCGFLENPDQRSRTLLELAVRPNHRVVVAFQQEIDPYRYEVWTSSYLSGSTWQRPSKVFGAVMAVDGASLEVDHPAFAFGSDGSVYLSTTYSFVAGKERVYQSTVARWSDP